MGVKFTSRMSQVSASIEKALDGAVQDISRNISGHAKVISPVDTGKLRSSEKITRNKAADYTVGFYTPYARRRHFENKKNPHTKMYLTKAGKLAEKDAGLMIRRRTSQVR